MQLGFSAGEVVGFAGDGVGQGAADCVRAEDDVGIGEEEVVGGGLAGGEGHGVGFAEPSCGEFGDVEGLEFFWVLRC